MSDGTIDLNSPEIQAAIAAAIEQETQGLKAKNKELLGKLSDTKTAFDDLKNQLTGVDLKKYREFSEKLKQDDDARLIAEGKIDDVINNRVQAMQQQYESKLQQTASEAELYKSKVLNGYIASAAAQAGVDPSAIDLVSLMASQSGVKLDERGNPVIVNGDGNIVYSADGVTPKSLNDWLAELRSAKPLLWGQPQGTGALGNQGGQSQKKPEDFTEQEKRDMFHSNREEYNRIFKNGVQ